MGFKRRDDEEKNVIFTDYEHVHMKIWEIYENWSKFFPPYLLAGENVLAVKRWAFTFISFTQNTYKTFEEELNTEDIEGNKIDRIRIIMDIYRKLNYGKLLEKKDYILVNEFINTYLFITGISNVIKAKEDPNRAIEAGFGF